MSRNSKRAAQAAEADTDEAATRSVELSQTVKVEGTLHRSRTVLTDIPAALADEIVSGGRGSYVEVDADTGEIADEDPVPSSEGDETGTEGSETENAETA